MINFSSIRRKFFRPSIFFVNIAGIAFLASFTLQDSNKPDESRFTPVVIADNLDEPMVFEVLPDGSAYIAERKGALK